MSEQNRDYADLRREVIEARNQSIKTDNQIKNLSLDVKGFENRFDIVERRLRFSQVGLHFIVAFTIAMAAYFISAARTRGLQEELALATQAANKIQQAVATKSTELDSRLQEIEDGKRSRRATQENVIKLLAHLDKAEIDPAVSLLGEVELERLSPLEKRLTVERINKFRSSVAEQAYREGRDLVARGRRTDSIKAFERSVKVHPEGRYAATARYLLGLKLREGKRFAEAIEVFDEILKRDSDKEVIAEIKYWKAYSLGKVGKVAEAKSILRKIASEGGRHASAAQIQLNTLEPEVAAIR